MVDFGKMIFYDFPLMTERCTDTRRPPSAELPTHFSTVYLALLTGSVVLSFYPLLTYFFAQDDFALLAGAAHNGPRAVLDFFSETAGQFRPLTKAVYFGVMYKLFGLNAAAYHAVSVLVHVINAVLLYVFLIRCRVSRPASLIAATLFALNVAFFHVIAWAACIQQLLGQCFMLAASIKGIDYLRKGSRADFWLSLAAYALALASMEQSFAVPAILLAFAFFDTGGRVQRPAPSEALRRLSPHLGLMAAYLLFIGVYKGTPQDGPYVFSLGTNVIKNVFTYLTWTVHFWPALPKFMNAGVSGFSGAHIFLAALLIYQLAMRRVRSVIFGLVYFLAAIFPALFLSNHTFYLHTYIPAFGILYLIAILAEDVLSARVLRYGAARYVFLLLVLAAASAMSFVTVRKNERLTINEAGGYKQSFVLRRAEIARNVYESITEWKSPDDKITKVYMVYAFEGGRDDAAWHNENVKAATGMGRLVNLIYKNPDMPVEFFGLEDKLDKSEIKVTDVYFYDDVGNCRRLMMRGESGADN